MGEGSLVGGLTFLRRGLVEVVWGETERERSDVGGMGGRGRLIGGRECIECRESLEMLETRWGMLYRAGTPVGTSGKASSWMSVRSS